MDLECAGWESHPRQGYDVDKDLVFQDLLRPAGFSRAVRDVLRIKKHGLLFGGVPCNSFIFFSAGTHRRSAQQPWGNEKHSFVRVGNTLGSRFAFLAALATVRGVLFAIENPRWTFLYWLPPLKWLLQLPIGALAVRWCLVVLSIENYKVLFLRTTIEHS